MHDSDLLAAPDTNIFEALERLNRNAKGVVLVVDAEQRLIGTVTDGDVRRAILARKGLDTPLSELLESKARLPHYPEPVTARVGTSRAELLRLMKDRRVHQVPILDGADRVVGLVTLDELLPDQELPLQAVIMAGGSGTRLRPLTETTPKPMLPMGDRPLIERIVDRLRQAGIRRVNIATCYLPDKIKEHFGDGTKFGVELDYVTEEQPLGTAGALGLIETGEEPILIVNGDILTRIDYKAMHAFHREQKADLTMAVREYDVQVPYGIVEGDGVYVRRLTEKPVQRFYINAGIYLLDPSVCRYIPAAERFDMTDLIQRLLAEGRPVASFPVLAYWLDIGRPEEYKKALDDVQEGRLDT